MILRVLVILSIISFLCKVQADQKEYCAISSKHTLCQYVGPARSCGNVKDRTVNDDEKKFIVNYHNSLRRKVAKGIENRGLSTGVPAAGNMRKLSWDFETAAVAQRWSEQCKKGHDCNECRNLTRFTLGQNFYGTSGPYSGRELWKLAIDAWYNEVDDVHRDDLFPYTGSGKSGKVIGHFTQIVWAETFGVGCGKTSTETYTFVFCNYAPAGNFYNKDAYGRGKACSLCESPFYCHDSLCVNSNNSYTDLTFGKNSLKNLKKFF